jgi:putative ABC transport system permease protein
MGTGALVTGVASVIIGTSIFRKLTFVKATTAVVIGSILYKACVQLAMSQDILVQQDQKLITSMLFLIILVTSNERKRRVKAHA